MQELSEIEKKIYKDFVYNLEIAYHSLEDASKDWISLNCSENKQLNDLINDLPFNASFQEIVDKLGIYMMKLKSKNI